MEFLFAAKVTSAGLLQRTSVASAMEPSVGDATKATMGASTLAGTSVMDQSAVTKASVMDQSAVTKASFMSQSAAGTAASHMEQSRASHSLHPFRLDQGPAGQGQLKDDTSVMSEDALDTLTTKDYNDRPTHPPVPLPGETTKWRFLEETLPPIPPDSEWINFGRGDLRVIRERAYIMSTDLQGLTYDQKAAEIGYQCWVAGCIYKHTQPYSCDYCPRKVHLGCATQQDYYHPGDDQHIYCCAACKYADHLVGGYANSERWEDPNTPMATLGTARLDRIPNGSLTIWAFTYRDTFINTLVEFPDKEMLDLYKARLLYRAQTENLPLYGAIDDWNDISPEDLFSCVPMSSSKQFFLDLMTKCLTPAGPPPLPGDETPKPAPPPAPPNGGATKQSDTPPVSPPGIDNPKTTPPTGQSITAQPPGNSAQATTASTEASQDPENTLGAIVSPPLIPLPGSNNEDKDSGEESL